MIFDNAASVLRAACIAKQNCYNIPLPTKNDRLCTKYLALEEIEFSTLAKHLTEMEPCKSEALLKYDFRLFTEIAVDILGNLRVVLIAEPDADCLPGLDDTVFIFAQNSMYWRYTRKPRVTKVDGSRYYLDMGETIPAPLSVHRPTDVWVAANDLSMIRNRFVGHPSSTNLSDDALETMLAKVKKAYDKLMPAVEIPEDDCKKLMDEFEKIKEGMSNNGEL